MSRQNGHRQKYWRSELPRSETSYRISASALQVDIVPRTDVFAVRLEKQRRGVHRSSICARMAHPLATGDHAAMHFFVILLEQTYLSIKSAWKISMASERLDVPWRLSADAATLRARVAELSQPAAAAALRARVAELSQLTPERLVDTVRTSLSPRSSGRDAHNESSIATQSASAAFSASSDSRHLASPSAYPRQDGSVVGGSKVDGDAPAAAAACVGALDLSAADAVLVEPVDVLAVVSHVA